MKLRYALLGLIAELDGASGYDLLKVFDISLGTVWQATQSQLYGELGKLSKDGLIAAAAEGPRRRTEYAVTDAGRAELRGWLAETPGRLNPRDEPMLRVFFLDQLDPGDALDYLRRMADTLTERAEELDRLEKAVPWEEGGALADNGRLTMEYGRRFIAMRRDWFVWAGEQYQARIDAGARGTAPGTAPAEGR